MRHIPTVKLWVITLLHTGQKIEIMAPTRYLALLNYRYEYGFAEIKSIGLKRSK